VGDANEDQAITRTRLPCGGKPKRIGARVGAFQPWVTTIIALAAAAISAFAVRNTRQIAEAQIVLKFREEYATDQMLTDLRLLHDWKKNHGDQFASIWLKQFQGGQPEAIAVDRARRHVGHYFFSIYDLKQSRFLSKKTAKFLLNVSGLNLFYQIVEPLDRELAPETYAKHQYDALRKLRPSSENN
jgi:hypothetical protein